MNLKIVHIDGPLAGKTQIFGDDKSRIVFGRDGGHCDVVWPADYTAVSRQHFALVRTTGGYRFELGDNPVLIDGRPAYQDQYFENTAELQLGDAQGPRLNVTVEHTATAAAMPTTKAYARNVSAHEIAQKSRKKLAWVAGAVVAVAVGAGVALWQVNQIEPVNLAEYTQQLKSEIQTELATAVSPEVLQQTRDSVYLVLVRNAAGNEIAAATAWVVGDGVMATNAHVGEIFYEIEPGMTMLIRSPKPPYQTHQVTAVEIHPGYHAFDEAVQEYKPVVMGLWNDLAEPRLVPAYDVALLKVDQAETLAPPLKLADEPTLDGLLPGMAVAYVGYPTEQLSNVDAIRAPNPVIQSGGTLTGITDFFNVRREDNVNQLVQHNLGATGGASGSPIVNPRGEVVAVLSAGNIIITETGRAPSAVGINFAQRADLVREMLEGEAEENLVAYRRIWSEGLALFDNFRSVLPKVFVSDLQAWAKSSKDPVEIDAKSDKVGPMQQDWGVNATIYEYDVQPGAYGFYAISQGEDDINLAVIQDGTVLVMNNESDWFPIVATTFDKPGRIQVVVFAAIEGAPYDYRALQLP